MKKIKPFYIVFKHDFNHPHWINKLRQYKAKKIKRRRRGRTERRRRREKHPFQQPRLLTRKQRNLNRRKCPTWMRTTGLIRSRSRPSTDKERPPRVQSPSKFLTRMSALPSMRASTIPLELSLVGQTASHSASKERGPPQHIR